MTNYFRYLLYKMAIGLFALNCGFIPLATAAEQSPIVRILPEPGNPNAVPCTVYAPKEVAGRKAGLIVHLYGSGGSHESYNLKREAYDQLRRELYEAGYWVVVPELGPKHWMNAHAASTLDEVIAGMLSHENIDPQRVHLLGTSMGAGSALIYARDRQKTLRSLCLFFPMTDFEAWVAEKPSYRQPIIQAHGLKTPSEVGPALRALSPLHYAKDFIDTPIYITHGDADDTVPVHHSRDFAQEVNRAGGHVTYREIRGGTHYDDIAVGWDDEILKFFSDAEAHNRDAK